MDNMKNTAKKPDDKFVWPIIGNRAAFDFLDKSYLLGNVAQTYIFSGIDDLGKALAAQCFAGRLIFPDFNPGAIWSAAHSERLANCGDCHVVERLAGKKNISIDQIREFINILGLGSFSNSRKVGIITVAETLSLEAANSLLKLLEEPAANTVIILLTSSLDSILPTIVSRAQVINFFPVGDTLIRDYLRDNFGASLAVANELAALSGGRPARALRFLSDREFYNSYLKQVQTFLGFLKSDISERWTNIAGLLAGVEETTATAQQTIETWEAVTRDLLLLLSDNADLIWHRAFAAELKELAESLDIIKVNEWLALLKKSKEYLAANVTPKNALEYIASNI